MERIETDSHRFVIAPSRIAWRLAFVAVLLVAANLFMQFLRLAAERDYLPGLALINLDGEHNLPALFSVFLLVAAAMLIALIAILERRRLTRDAGRWAILSAGFVLMALDEALSLHEKLIEPIRGMLGDRELGIFYFAWIIPAIPLVIVLAAFYLPFLLRLPRRTAIAFTVSAAIYLGGALGVELVEGWWREGHGHRNAVYHLLVSIEEGMEMVGIIVFIHALLDYASRHYRDVRLTFDAAEPVLEQEGPIDAIPLARPTAD